ncbi:MAG: LLM class flavin-dependent oxidoreductase, partial [Methylobacteriaceae bacterium]|nr:LLM class flavin-dependent oxidoreductase [Methylobacteriaceae bacterium]
MAVELLILGAAPISQMVEHVKLAERSGYDTVWLADERFYREVYSCLSIFASATKTVKLGPCVTDPFARHPALTAVAIATLDEISDGRAILGLGAGVSGFAELGIDRKKPPRAMRETIELVRKLLAGGDVDYQGEIVCFNNGHLSFKPRRADIPVVIASNGPLGQRTAGALCQGAIMEACASIPEVEAFAAEVVQGARKAGRDPKHVPLTTRLNL